MEESEHICKNSITSSGCRGGHNGRVSSSDVGNGVHWICWSSHRREMSFRFYFGWIKVLNGSLSPWWCLLLIALCCAWKRNIYKYLQRLNGARRKKIDLKWWWKPILYGNSLNWKPFIMLDIFSIYLNLCYRRIICKLSV